MSETLPGTWDKFVNKTDKISYPQEAYFHGKKIIIKKVKYTVLLSDTEDTPKKEEVSHADIQGKRIPVRGISMWEVPERGAHLTFGQQ